MSNNNPPPRKAETLGAPFHNPYTFIPFPEKAPERHKPTPLTIDEVETDRLSGVLDITLQTRSPLLVPAEKEKGKETSALRIGNDVIVPASLIRGMLRSLCAIISGSALDYVDDQLWLCQGRDANLGNQKLYLAEIITPGDSSRAGKVRFGKATLVDSFQLGLPLKTSERDRQVLWIDNPDGQWIHRSNHKDDSHTWRVKISGNKVNSKSPHEGAFQPDKAKEIILPEELWSDYTGRHRNAAKKELRTGDIVWLEPKDPSKGIVSADDVKSIQWARWGRHGVNFRKSLEKLLKHLLPDSVRNDGLVDITSDLFGSIPMPEEGEKESYPAFAARIRPGNLIFKNASTSWNEMPVSGAPHPGCKAFYVANEDYDLISLHDTPRGYKVYRTSKHEPGKEPWTYKSQPVFAEGKPKSFDAVQQAGARKCELLKPYSSGNLKISFRALTKKELALLLLVLSCDLRIGGGKPFGLGHCVVSRIHALDEYGSDLFTWSSIQKASLPDMEMTECLPEYFMERAKLYCKTQIPVEMLRYPRAEKGGQKSGAVWFGTFAAQKNNKPHGLQTAKINGQEIRPQMLPVFDPQRPEADWLFGYDFKVPSSGNREKNYSPNARTRENDRKKR